MSVRSKRPRAARDAIMRLYRDRRGEWRWQFRARNGKIMADSAEGYRRFGSCRRSLIVFMLLVSGVTEGEVRRLRSK